MENNSSERYHSIDTFTNCNEIKKLSNSIMLSDIITPNSETASKLIEIVARARCLTDFELLPDGHILFSNCEHGASRVESPEGVGQVSVKT